MLEDALWTVLYSDEEIRIIEAMDCLGSEFSSNWLLWLLS